MVAAVLPTDARTSMPRESADDVSFAVSHKPIRNQTNRRSSVARRVHSGEVRPVAVPGCVDRAGVPAASLRCARCLRFEQSPVKRHATSSHQWANSASNCPEFCQ